MWAANEGVLRRQVPLGVEIVHGALTLAAGNTRVTYSEAWRERCPFDTRNGAIVGRRPAFLGHIEPCINGQAQIIESAGADIDIHDGGRTESVVEAYRNTLAFRGLSTAIFAKTRSEEHTSELQSPMY